MTPATLPEYPNAPQASEPVDYLLSEEEQEIEAAKVFLLNVLSDVWRPGSEIRAMQDWQDTSPEALRVAAKLLIRSGEIQQDDTGKRLRLTPLEIPPPADAPPETEPPTADEAEPEPEPEPGAVHIPAAAKLLGNVFAGDVAGLERMLCALEKELGHPIERTYRTGREAAWDADRLAAGNHDLQGIPREEWDERRRKARKALIAADSGRSHVAIDRMVLKLYRAEMDAEIEAADLGEEGEEAPE